MKKIYVFILICISFFAVSCAEKTPVTVNVPVQLVYDGQPLAAEGVLITLTTGEASFEGTTDASGLATFTVPVGIYTASSSFKQSQDGILLNYNGNANVTVVSPTDEAGFPAVQLNLTSSKSSQLIIKELYNGGCMDNDNNKSYIYDKYIIIYNNSDVEVDASNMCLAMAQIMNTLQSNKYEFDANGIIEYELQGWTPASYGIWWFQPATEVKIAPYSQIVISITGAIDHTQTYANSVDLSNADYCLYDLESGFNMALHYPAPSASIPESHYMKASYFGTGTAWAFPMQNAAPFIIIPTEDIKAFLADPANFDNRGTNLGTNYAKVRNEWVLDALDIWSADDNTKFFGRFPTAINTGYVTFTTNKLGYSIYRNVDKAATEAIEENSGKLVYDYSGAVDAETDTDPSGIDAEASIANGAKIVYMDTNNSDNDFHVRKVASIKK